MTAYEPNPRKVVVARFLFDSAEDAARAVSALDGLDLGAVAAEVYTEDRA